MTLDQKVRYALMALAVASLLLAGLGLHMGGHLRVLEGGGNADQG
ncbi:MAG TPA: hypothetical protein VLX56_07730 [Nitrososphaerales archaeon]|nr:hypothetical protein [Nitrososphaerales archaeon]